VGRALHLSFPSLKRKKKKGGSDPSNYIPLRRQKKGRGKFSLFRGGGEGCTRASSSLPSRGRGKGEGSSRSSPMSGKEGGEGGKSPHDVRPRVLGKEEKGKKGPTVANADVSRALLTLNYGKEGGEEKKEDAPPETK